MENIKYKTTKSVLVGLGDVHGEWHFIASLCERFRDLCIIQVGDFGLGFHHPLKEKARLDRLEAWLASTNNELFAIRGNHDNPAPFVGQVRKHITLLPDYSILDHQGKKIQLIGGGISIDRTDRVLGKSFWKGEEVIFQPERVEKSDVLITHVAPKKFPLSKAQCNPVVAHYHKVELALGKNLLKELENEMELTQVFTDRSECKTHYFGHYHRTQTFLDKENGRRYWCIDIGQTREIV